VQYICCILDILASKTLVFFGAVAAEWRWQDGGDAAMHDAVTFMFGLVLCCLIYSECVVFLEGVPRGALLWRAFEMFPAGLFLPCRIRLRALGAL
jgi:hypothetical protein